ncbi:tetratricopeptide repeat protein, partial [Candidatus Micrarchaeota archaeon]|nr:tetratricopeptide repeat protein [Candidatus Micrarchaeota archaeon]
MGYSAPRKGFGTVSFIRWLLEALRPGLTPSHSGQAEFPACATADRSAAPLSSCLAFAFIFSFFLVPSFAGGGESPEQKAALEEAGKLHKEAGAFRQAGKLSEAAASYIRAAIIRESVLGPEHPDVAASLNSLGSVYNERRQYALAESVHKR